MRIILLIACFCVVLTAKSQITGFVCAELTQYTNNNPNDSIYLYPEGALGSLLASPTTGTAPYTFDWAYFNSTLGSWTSYLSEITNNVSLIDSLQPGAYNVIITDANGVSVGCDNAWIVQYATGGGGGLVVDLDPIPPSCESMVLSGTITLTPPWGNGFTTGYSNLPPNPMFVDASTEISVCFSGTHTWVSDIAFYLVGPVSCGSPSVVLSPNPGSIGQGSVCNSGNNISNLCFSTESTNNLNICSATTPLSGTYGTYGLTNTAPVWSTFYGCETTSAGWSVQIYDCIGGDVGALTDATLTFTGLSGCGGTQTITYSTPPGYSSAITDNSCSAGTASIFQVPAISIYSPITCNTYAEISAEPYQFIADSLDQIMSFPYTFSMTIPIPYSAPGIEMPMQDFDFTLSVVSDCYGEISDNDAAGNTCISGGSADISDTEHFTYIPWQPSSIFGPATICQFQGIVPYAANVTGVFSGPFVTPGGLFDPMQSGVGQFVIQFTPDVPCVYSSSFNIEVVPQYTPFLTPAGPFCVDAGPVFLQTNMPGSFFGPGTSPFGLFDPALAGVGTHNISFDAADQCGGSATLTIEVFALPIVTVSNDADVCYGLPYSLAAGGALTYAWSPATYLSAISGAAVNASPTSDISYTVTGTDVNGCISSDQVHLTVLPLPTIQINPISISCPGAGVTLSATGSVGAYQWEPATGLTTPTQISTDAIIYESASYILTITDNCGLIATDEVFVEIEPALTVNTGLDQAYCAGTTASVTAIVNGNFHSLAWSTPNGVIDPNDVDQLTITVSSPGSYVLTASTLLGCSANDGLTITETPLPTLNLNSPLYICPNGEVNINAGAGWDEVQWDNGVNTAMQTVMQAGIYNVTVTNDNCSSSGSVEVLAITLPYLELGPDVSICVDDAATFVIAEPGQWSGGSFSDQFTTSSPGNYGVTIVDGPCSITDSVSVTTRPLPFVDLPDEMIGCIDQGVVISASHPNNTSYYWNTGDTTSSTIVYESGIYIVAVGNDCGMVQDQVSISYEDCSYTLYLPNSFTPDNDGLNDVWKIETYNIAKINFHLYNRFGEQVLESEDPHFVWTGEFQDGEHYSPDGIYTYRLSYESTEGDVGTRKGIIFMLR